MQEQNKRPPAFCEAQSGSNLALLLQRAPVFRNLNPRWTQNFANSAESRKGLGVTFQRDHQRGAIRLIRRGKWFRLLQPALGAPKFRGGFVPFDFAGHLVALIRHLLNPLESPRFPVYPKLAAAQ